jgi:hypothetical protein
MMDIWIRSLSGYIGCYLCLMGIWGVGLWDISSGS